MDEIPLVGADGTTNVSFSIFLISFTLLVPWVVLQLTGVVLLDSFVKVTLPPSSCTEHTLRDLRLD